MDLAHTLAGWRRTLHERVFDRARAATFARFLWRRFLDDRLFDAAMARIEAMEPHRAALIAIAKSEGVEIGRGRARHGGGRVHQVLGRQDRHRRDGREQSLSPGQGLGVVGVETSRAASDRDGRRWHHPCDAPAAEGL